MLVPKELVQQRKVCRLTFPVLRPSKFVSPMGEHYMGFPTHLGQTVIANDNSQRQSLSWQSASGQFSRLTLADGDRTMPLKTLATKLLQVSTSSGPLENACFGTREHGFPKKT